MVTSISVIQNTILPVEVDPYAVKNGHLFVCNPNFLLVEVDPCAVNNGGCAQVCKNIFGRAQCTCKFGFELHSNGKGCTGNQSTLFFCFFFQ